MKKNCSNAFKSMSDYSVTFFPEPPGSRIFSGLISFMTQTAAITVLIGLGGFFIDLTNVISAGFRVSRAANAAVVQGLII